MFGGLAYLIGGNMAIAASGQGGILVRVDPERSDTLVRTTKATVAVMQGRKMPGWLRLKSEDVRTTPQLRKWATLGTEYARSLPPKRK
jgi:ribosomal protein L39E